MAIVTFSKKQFEKDIGILDEKMKTKIAMFGTPIEKEEEKEISIEVFPNRPDLLSYHGFKRSFLSFLGKKTGLQTYKINKPEENYRVVVDSSVKDIRPYTACAIVRGLVLDNEKIKEIIEMQERLHITIGRKRKKAAIGIYPLEKIQLPITFKAVEPDKIKFIPLEMDKELSGLEILQRHSAGKEFAHLLAGKIKFPVFVDSKEQILSMPPIINSQLTGRITEQTKDVFIECSGFDLKILKICLNILVTSMADMGARVYQMEIKYGITKKEITPELSPRNMKISLENTNKLLGTEINEKQLKQLLEKMGYNYEAGVAKIPAWRADILHEVDLIEDIAIAYGYENFIPEIPDISTIGEEDFREKIKGGVALILSGLGLLEVSSYHLTNRKNQIENMGLGEKENVMEVEGSKTEYSVLRRDLSHSLLKILSENVDSEYPHNIFEIGKVFPASEKVTEKESLALALSPGNFTEVKQVIEYLFRMLDLEISFNEPKNRPLWFIEGRTAEILLDGKCLGFIGEIHPKILKNWKIKMPVALFEIDIGEILKESAN
ncbi:MAG: phenylalanine--tRNA ligase subunit beta [Candidatus Pacearchaeota archaeon]|nr:phenylalanine--tRNA ligase subunit beta [Candidatus Pacearchaeota archaeon]